MSVKAGKEIVAALNEILEGELAAINQYFLTDYKGKTFASFFQPVFTLRNIETCNNKSGNCLKCPGSILYIDRFLHKVPCAPR